MEIHPTNPFTEFGEEEIEQSIPLRFEQQVAKDPDRLAFKSRIAALTYGDLNRLANRIARAIVCQRGSGQEPVALLMGQGATLIGSVLGALKARKIYVPLDPFYPRARLSSMLKDSGVVLILADRESFDLARELADSTEGVVNVEEIQGVDDGNLGLEIAPEALSYILYTSGTTGEPKGIFQNHRNVLHKVMNYTNTSHLSVVDHLSLLVSFSFSAAVPNVFAALLNGAALFAFNLKEDGLANLARWLAEEKITIYQSVTTVFRHFLETLSGAEKFPRLRLIDLFGEPVLPVDVEAYKKHFADGCLLRNRMASTELGDVCQYFISKETPIVGNIVPVGYPVKDKEVLLLDEAGREVGFNGVGEIVVKSPYLALGYWGKPELTQTTFIPDPQGGDARIYRTGDLGYLLPDGCLVHMGRKDFQVKIRGHRIEPGEIEAALLGHRGIKEAVVVARESGRRGKSLAAYLVPKGQPAPSSRELRGWLQQKLPDYMIPSALVFLDALPLTPNGKVNLQALPAPRVSREDDDPLLAPARNPVEQELARIWSTLFEIGPIGIDDNFFDMGGDSLLAAQFLSRISSAFGVSVSLRVFWAAPTVRALAEAVSQRIEQRTSPTSDLLAKRTSRCEQLPLSFAQESLWFLDRMEPGTPAYNIHTASRLSGKLDAVALEKSLKEIIRRHESLRTTFATVEGRPIQIIAKELSFTLPIIDLRHLSRTERETEVLRLSTAETHWRFDLERGPLFRAALARSDDEEYVLFLTLHHIVGDAWSVGVLYRELSVLYDSFTSGVASELPELDLQYADFALWQRDWFQGKELEKQLLYWKERLGTGAPVAEILTDRPRPAVQSYRGARFSARLSEDLSESLRGFCRQEGASLFMALLAAFKVLLHRHTGQDQIVQGATVAGRNRPETEVLIGFFINALVLRANLSGRPTFRALLRRVREVCLEAYAHQDLPFERLLEELRPDRSPNRTPLFQTLFNMQNLPEGRLKLRGLRVDSLVFPEVMSKFDLTLYAWDQEERIRMSLVYNADLFDDSRMKALLDQLQHLLSQIVQDPDKEIDSYSLVTPATKSFLPNPTVQLDATWHGPVHAFFSEQARLAPQKTAVSDPQESWSYEELEGRSNQLAHYLKESGIQREDIVAVYSHRSASLVWALLGILKAGAAFLILDPAYPALRLIGCLRGARPQAWLQLQTAGPLPEALSEFVAELPLRCRLELPARLEASTSGPWTGFPMDDPNVEVGPDDLAYVAFTSGSTGEPKGVLCRHGAVSHFLPWLQRTFGLGDKDRFSCLTGLSFNPLHREIFHSVALGATLCIPDPDEIAPGRLADWMQRESITIAHLTPAMVRVLCEAAQDKRIETLRCAFFAGDVLKRRDVRMLQNLAPGVTSINFYGATETQRAVGHFIVPAEQALNPEKLASGESTRDTIPLGRGIEDVQLLVLNSSQNLAGVGEIGEIHFRSPHLAKGYLDDEALTRKRFITNPFTQDPRDRLYRTFELGRYLPDGNVEFAGRMDQQIKVRGFRVEPAEIETTLLQHVGVRQAVVGAQDETAGDKRLVAYVVANPIAPPTFKELRSFLKERLPDYMVPSAFVYLENLPLTPNGKVDRQQLSALAVARPAAETTLVAPRTPVESLIAEVWKELLGIDRVSIDDNFFDLGGHSLLSIQAVTRLEKRFGFRIEPKELLVRNLTQLAAIYEERQKLQDAPQPRSLAQKVLNALAQAFSRKREDRPS